MLFTLRRFAAICFAATLAWDYSRSSEIVRYFSSWSLFLQFVYFQLPIKSRALCFSHTASFICAVTVPITYLYSLLKDPHIELNHAESWNLSYSTVIVRTVLVHFLPLVFHVCDLAKHQTQLIHSYQTRPRHLMIVWAFISYMGLSLLFELYSRGIGSIDEELDSEEDRNILTDTSLINLARGQIVVSIFAFAFSFFLLMTLVLRPAYLTRTNNNSTNNMNMPSPRTRHSITK